MTQHVLATIVIPMRNEAGYIVPCLESLLANEAPGPLELLVYDGASTDGSAELVAELATRHPEIQLFANPRRLQAIAFNEALGRARGEYFLRADAHSTYPPDYVSECLRLLHETGAHNVGGLQRAEGNSVLTRAIAVAVSSPFGAGDAKYRHATEPTYTDTVYLGAWNTERLRSLGGMREDWAVNEDYELNVRLRAAGGRVFLSPTIRSTYFVRGSLSKLARQYLRYGFWKVRTLMVHPASLRARQLAAPMLVLAAVATWPLVHAIGLAGVAPLALYAAANLVASAVEAGRSAWLNVVLLPVIFAVIHFSWGLGFWSGLLYWPVRNSVSSDLSAPGARGSS